MGTEFSNPKINRTVKETRKSKCSNCSNMTQKVIASYSRDWSNTDYPDDLYGKEIYEILQCMNCDEICFRKKIITANDYDFRTGELITYEKVYPEPFHRNEIEDVGYLPEKIENIYIETYQAICNRMPILAAAGIRSVIEAICHDKGEYKKDENTIERRGLRKLASALVDLNVLTRQQADSILISRPVVRVMLDSLVEERIITDKNREHLHVFMNLGNVALHDAECHSQESLDTAMDIVEHVLKEIYINRRKVDKNIPKRPGKKKTPEEE